MSAQCSLGGAGEPHTLQLHGEAAVRERHALAYLECWAVTDDPRRQRRIQAGLEHPNARVIMVTGNTDPDLAREAFRLGALAYVDKPFDLDYLKRVVTMALNEGWIDDTLID